MCSSFGVLWVESRDFSQAKKERIACKAKQTHKMTTIFNQKNNLGPFWVKIVVILWICSALQAVLSFSALEKSCFFLFYISNHWFKPDSGLKSKSSETVNFIEKSSLSCQNHQRCHLWIRSQLPSPCVSGKLLFSKSTNWGRIQVICTSRLQSYS